MYIYSERNQMNADQLAELREQAESFAADNNLEVAVDPAGEWPSQGCAVCVFNGHRMCRTLHRACSTLGIHWVLPDELEPF